MTFTTVTFAIFLGIVFTLYWSLRTRRAQNVLLLIASYFFYGWWDWRFCGLMLASSLLDYYVGIGLERIEEKRTRKWLLGIGLSGNIAMLGFFKYFNFFAENVHAIAAKFGWHVDPITLNVVLPVGISFYTFQTMSYSIDIYRRQIHATTHLTEYLAYVSFFPQLVAGPIERAKHLLPQFLKDRTFSYESATEGCRQVLWGVLKKMVVADNLGPIADAAFSNPGNYNGAELVLATVAFAFQIYCDFSAYSDIACGVARLFGFELMRNFAYPYFSQSIAEFWRRWHISLSTWFKDYVYFPLGGNRVSKSRMAMNVMITFVLSGLWHGASWNFVIWGAWNGLGVLPGIIYASHKRRTAVEMPAENPNAFTLVKILGTFGFICIGWIFFRAGALADATMILNRIVTKFMATGGGLLSFNDATKGRIWFALGLLVVAEWVKRRNVHPLIMERSSGGLRWAVYTVLFWTVLYLGTYGSNTFIYFQF